MLSTSMGKIAEFQLQVRLENRFRCAFEARQNIHGDFHRPLLQSGGTGGFQAPAVLQVHERRHVQRLWSLIALKAKDEEHMVVPRRVGHFTNTHMKFTVVLAEIDLNGILMILCCCRAGEQLHIPTGSGGLSNLLRSEPPNGFRRPPGRWTIQIDQRHTHPVAKAVLRLQAPRVRHVTLQKLHAVAVLPTEAQQGQEKTTQSPCAMDENCSQ
mmetsp:Transcript_38003/g.81723  ORF Transcript_38003/g.81723 Transcript_38003/m.81723 type:complete len:212 (+) Transcript_38003:235-870(+)